MSSLYIKLLGTQELGYRKGQPGGGGRYIYISKQCTEFFPHLSVTQLNDTVLIPIVPPFTQQKVYTSYVYHNDKHILDEGTRDEYRLYLNKGVDPHADYYKPGDIVVFQRVVGPNPEDQMMPTYFLHRFESTSQHYAILSGLIEESKIKGGHALIEAQLEFIPEVQEIEAGPVIIPPEVMADAEEKQKEILDEEVEEIEEVRGAHLFNSVSFRDFVLTGYEYKCAVTGQSILWKQLNNLEAAHIKPRAHTGSFLPCNGIALSRDMHWAFDKGFFTIGDDYHIIVHEEVQASMLGAFHGTQMNLPKDDFFKPDKTYLKHHRENIYGLFRHSGVIRAL